MNKRQIKKRMKKDWIKIPTGWRYKTKDERKNKI
jgi:hypothetical protein